MTILEQYRKEVGEGLGHTDALLALRDAGFALGDIQVLEHIYSEGSESGYESGRDVGYDSGYESGYDSGYDAGYESGRESGYESGYDAAKDEEW